MEQSGLKRYEENGHSDQDSEDHEEYNDSQPQSQRQTQVQDYQLTKDREK